MHRRMSPTGYVISASPQTSRARGLAAHNPSPVSAAATSPPPSSLYQFPHVPSEPSHMASSARGLESQRRRQTVSEMRSIRRRDNNDLPQLQLKTSEQFSRDRSPLRLAGGPRIVPLLPHSDQTRKDVAFSPNESSHSTTTYSRGERARMSASRADETYSSSSRDVPMLPLSRPSGDTTSSSVPPSSSQSQKRATFADAPAQPQSQPRPAIGSSRTITRAVSVESTGSVGLTGVAAEPIPATMQKVRRAQQNPDKYRDIALSELLQQLIRGVPVPEAQTTKTTATTTTSDVASRRSSQLSIDSEGVSPEVAAATAAAVMYKIADEMHRPMRDHCVAQRELRNGLRRAADILSTCPPRDVNTVQLLGAASRVTSLHAKRDRDQAAADAVESGILQVFAKRLKDSAVVKSNPEFARDALHTLSNGLASSSTYDKVHAICRENKTAERAVKITKDPDASYETTQAAAEFGMLYSDIGDRASSPASQGSTHDHSPSSTEPRQLEVMMRVVARRVRDKPTQRLSVQESLSAMLDKPIRDQPRDDLEKLVRAFDTPENIQNPNLAAKFAELVYSYAARDRHEELVNAGAHEVLLKVSRAHPEDMTILGQCLDAFASMAENSHEMSLFVAEHVIPVVRVPNIVEDPDVVCQYVDLLEDMVVNGGQELTRVLPRIKVLKDMDLLESIADPLDSELLAGIADIRAALEDKRKSLTLKEVYSVLLARQHNDDSLNINEDRSMKRLYHYIIKKVSEYGTGQEITDGIFGFIGSEFMFGCMCFQILAGVEDNHAQLIRHKVPNLLLDSLAKQTDEQVAQHAVLTAVELASTGEKLASEFVNTQAKKELIVSVLERGRKATEYEMYNEVEDLVGARVQLIEKTAITRDTYIGTEALAQLIETWDDYDFFWYGNIRVRDKADLQRLFKLERREQRKDFFKDVMRKRRDHKRSKEAAASQVGSGGSGGGATGSELQEGGRLTLRRRSSIFGRKGLPSQDEVSPTLTVSPLERRKSVVGGAASPLERRRSMIGGASGQRRGSLGAASEKGGIMRRASQFLIGGRSPTTSAPSPQNSVALARRASVAGQNASIQRRTSLLHRDKSAFRSPSALVLDSPGNTARASVLQRRASLASPTASPDLSHVSQKLAGAMSYKSGEGETSTRSGDAGSSSRWSQDIDGGEGGVFVPRMLEYIFRAMRRVVEPSALGYLELRNVPMRLVGVTADLDTPPAAFPDILFLIGTLAPLGSMKETFHKYKAVEKICNLLKRAYKQNGTFVCEVVTNACLALATLCVVHLPNTKKLQKKKGTELIVQTLQHRGSMNDHKSVNAACALICNLCYKNEEMKVALGEDGACEAVVKAMAAYQGSSGSEAGSKNIASLFKAIGNLALNQNNMEKMLASEIDSAFASFMGEVDEELDDQTVEACLRTLSNLVIEKDNMERFERVVVPLLSLLRKEIHTSAEIHRWAFLTVANLCRWPTNAKVFCRNDGLRTIVIRLPSLEKSAGLRASVITALGIQTTFPENIERLIDIGIFDIIAETLKDFLKMLENETDDQLQFIQGGSTSNLSSQVSPRGGVTAEQQAQLILQYSQLPISALRCCHRLLKERSAAEECQKAGVFELAQEVLLKSLFQGMLSYEALRVIFACLSFLTPEGMFPKLKNLMILARQDNKSAAAPESSADIYASPDDWGERELALLEEGDDPCGNSDCQGYGKDPTEPDWWINFPPQVHQHSVKPRPWEILKMTHRMTAMTEIVRKIATNEKALRNVRLQRVAVAWLAWVSCERVCLPSLFRRLDVPIDPDTHAPEESDSADDTMMDERPVHKQIDKRRSVWDTFKREKTRLKEESAKSKFGRCRKADLTSCVDIVRRLLENLWFDHDAVDLALILLNNLVFCAFGNEELSMLIADVTLYKSLKKLLEIKSEQAKPFWIMSFRNYKRFLQTESKFNTIFDGGDDDLTEAASVKSIKSKEPSRHKTFRSAFLRKDTDSSSPKRKKMVTKEDIALLNRVALTDLPLELSQWDIDPFPDGVQSLPLETKTRLRKGGRCEAIDAEGKRQTLLWKASHDLVLFEWKILPLDYKHAGDVDPQYPFSLAISRFFTISPGTNHPYFAIAAAQDRSIHESRCCVLKGPGTPASPSGVNLCVKFKDSGARDTFLQSLSNWREACAFGFI